MLPVENKNGESVQKFQPYAGERLKTARYIRLLVPSCKNSYDKNVQKYLRCSKYIAESIPLFDIVGDQLHGNAVLNLC